MLITNDYNPQNSGGIIYGSVLAITYIGNSSNPATPSPTTTPTPTTTPIPTTDPTPTSTPVPTSTPTPSPTTPPNVDISISLTLRLTVNNITDINTTALTIALAGIFETDPEDVSLEIRALNVSLYPK